jgi:triacylglycerol lipase
MASAPVPAPSLQDIQDARQKVMTSNFFALCHLMLCELSYTGETDPNEGVKQIKESLPTMPVPKGTVAGQWELGWGPCVTPNNSNLMFAAEFVTAAVPATPVFSVIVIRGTDTLARPSGVFTQLVEDIGASTQVPFPPGNNADAKIALGTQFGLKILTSFTDTSGRTVEEYAAGFAKANQGAPIVITGHSLGGCQTTVMAMNLASKVPASSTIVPTTFAAPTAGNDEFIEVYEQTFPSRPRWFNTLDLVPMAFAGLEPMKDLWQQCNRPAPDIFKFILDAFHNLLEVLGATYAQQPAGSSIMLNGVCQPAGAPAITRVPFNQIATEIEASLRDMAARAHIHIPIPDILFQGIIEWVKELLFQHLVRTGYWDAVKNTNGVAPIDYPFPEKAMGAAA